MVVKADTSFFPFYQTPPPCPPKSRMGGAIAQASRVSTAERRAKRALDAGARRRPSSLQVGRGGSGSGKPGSVLSHGRRRSPCWIWRRRSPCWIHHRPSGSGAAVATAGSGGAVAPAGSIWIWRRRGHRWIWRRRSPCWIWRRRSPCWIHHRPSGSGAAVATAGSGAGVGVEVPSSKDFNTSFKRLQYLLQ